MTRPEEGFCGTAACLAGHVALEQGFRVDGIDLWGDPVLKHPDGRELHISSPRDTTVERFAADYLGLSDDEAIALFNENNTLDNLRWVISDLCGQEDRSKTSKERLRRALERVEEAARVGLWDQKQWITVPLAPEI